MILSRKDDRPQAQKEGVIFQTKAGSELQTPRPVGLPLGGSEFYPTNTVAERIHFKTK